MEEDIATEKSVVLRGHKYVIDTNGVTKSNKQTIMHNYGYSWFGEFVQTVI